MKDNQRGLTIPDTKSYYQAGIIKTMCYWFMNRLANQWNKRECPEIDLNIHRNLAYDKAAISNGRDGLLKKMVLKQLENHLEKTKVGYTCHLCT